MHAHTGCGNTNLVLSETHLDDTGGISVWIIRVLLILLPPQEVGGVLAMCVACSLPREQHFSH